MWPRREVGDGGKEHYARRAVAGVGGLFILELITFVGGGVLLALEIVASRIIAPAFGNSIYVWGSLIGIILLALSAGYALGGRIADRWPSWGGFATVVFLSGVLVLVIPPSAPTILDQVTIADLGPRASPLVASLLLFFLPGAVMAMISPYAIRLRAKSIATIGNVAGGLYALSTAGSIVGTLLAAFILLPVLGVRTILTCLGGTLMILSALAWARSGRRWLALAAVVSGGLGAFLIAQDVGVRPEGVQVARDSVYHRITVTDAGTVRYLKLDNYWQSALDITQPTRTVFPYTDYMHLPLLFRPEAQRTLIVGLGGGTVPTRYAHDYPSMTVDVVELDPEVLAIARQYFTQPGFERMRPTVLDGRVFLTRSHARYDIVLLDAYLIDTIPFHLATREFWETVRAHLTPQGVVAWNIIGAVTGPRSPLFRAMYKTLAAVFPTVYVFPVDWERDGKRADDLRNIIVIGTRQPALDPAAIARAAADVRARRGVTIERFEAAARDLYPHPIATSDMPVLSDDYAPVDTLLAPH